MSFRYPIFGSNGIINYIKVPIKDDNDVRRMFIVVAQASPAVSIEMYLETCPIDYHAVSIGCNHREQIVEENMSSLGYDRVPSPVYCHNYEEDVKPRVNSTMVTQSVILMAENFVDIPIGNDDVDELDDEDDPPENNAFLNVGEYEVPSPLLKELNWNVKNAMNDETLTSRSGLWNESNELYEGL